VGTKAAARGDGARRAIYVEIRIADGADAESDEVLDDTSRSSTRGAEPPRRGLTLPLQTGSAIIGARVLSATGTARRSARRRVALRQRPGRRARGRAIGARGVHVNIVVHVASAVKDSSRRRRQGDRRRRPALDRRLGTAANADGVP
jgi:hypothetical protein